MSKKAIVHKTALDAEKVEVWETERLEHEANIAISLIERWGMVAANDNGEDSVGRQKLRLQSPEEVVNRACETAELAMKKFREKKWVMETPVPKPADMSLFDDDGERSRIRAVKRASGKTSDSQLGTQDSDAQSG